MIVRRMKVGKGQNVFRWTWQARNCCLDFAEPNWDKKWAGKGTQGPGLRPLLVLVAVRDLDPNRLGFGNLRERYFKHTVLVRGLDRGAAYIPRKPEGPMDPAVMAFCAMNPRVLILTPCRFVALGVDHERLVLDLHFKRVALQTGQVDAEAVPIVIFDHIDWRWNRLELARQPIEETVNSVKKPSTIPQAIVNQ